MPRTRQVQEVLVVDHDRASRRLVKRLLQPLGYVVHEAPTAGAALSMAARERPELVLLDVHLPDISGYEVLRRLRDDFGNDIAVVFLSGDRTEEFDRVAGMLLGADDYIVKPFSPREVAARVKALFRRLTAHAAPRASAGPFEIDEPRRCILFRGADLELSRYEFGLLKALVERPGQVFSRAQLMEKVWEAPDMSLERTIDSHIKSIRAKIRSVDAATEWIVTHRGFGYSLLANPPA
jgi:two-component system catabolic regulation response regulator CreB